MANMGTITITARTKVNGEWVSKSNTVEFPKFDPELENLREAMPAKEIFQGFLDAWTIKEQANLRREIEEENSTGEDEQEKGRKNKNAKLLGL